MNEFTGPGGCPWCHATQMAPLACAPGWWQAIWRGLSGRQKNQAWFCQRCGQRWAGPPANEVPGAGEDRGAIKPMTVSFANLIDSGGLGECPAWDLVELLNGHFSLQFKAIRDHQGYFDSIMGTAVQAFWEGPPVGKADAALLACRAALAQLRALETLRTTFPGLPVVQLSIGISSGRVIAGHLGPESCRSYSVLGDTVNLSQRLQAANRLYGTRILISQGTSQQAGTAMVTREIDAPMVKGRQNPVRIFELLGECDEVPAAMLLLREKFLEALDAYHRQEWGRAACTFKACLEISPNDGPSRLYLERLKDKPPRGV